MSRLTSQRCSGIKTGYWSPAKKDELIQRLGKYEDTGLEPEEIRKPTSWISVEERLPSSEEKPYLVKTQTGHYMIAKYRPAWHKWGVPSNIVVAKWTEIPKEE